MGPPGWKGMSMLAGTHILEWVYDEFVCNPIGAFELSKMGISLMYINSS